MAKIAIVKVRSPHDLEWSLPGVAGRALSTLGLEDLRRRLEATRGQPFMPQLTLPYLAALGHRHAERTGCEHRFTLIDDRADRIDLEGFDAAWFTAVTPTVIDTYRVSDRARRAGVKTVLGGIHAAALPEEAAPHVDALVLGEAESVVPDLLDDLTAGRGLRPVYRGGNASSLAGLPVPRWRDSSVEDYCPWIVPVQTSRGCRNACRFCSTTRYQGAARRHRPVEEVVEEIATLRRDGVLTEDKVVFFTDNNIVSDSDHRRGASDTRYARSLFAALEPLGILWIGQGEIGVADDPDLVALMARSGCVNLLVGFETIDQENFSTVGKPCNRVRTFESQIRVLHDHDIALIGCFIVGLDHDGPGVFAPLARFVQDHIDIPQLAVLTPFPGTAFYTRMKREGRLLHTNWSRYDITRVVFEPRGMSSRELDEGYRWLCQKLYSYPAILRRVLGRTLRSAAWRHPALTARGRFSSSIAPNLVYRGLCHFGEPKDGVRPSRVVVADLPHAWIPAALGTVAAPEPDPPPATALPVEKWPSSSAPPLPN
jgi:radical SAM superfamily enzyme YgiQ (UPF0313 family)